LDRALRSVKFFLILTSIFLTIVFSIISIYLNHRNANRILIDSYALTTENTARAIAFSLKIGDLNLAQARISDLKGVTQAEKVVVFDPAGVELIRVPTFSMGGAAALSCQHDSLSKEINYSGQSIGSISVCYEPLPFHFSNADVSTLIWFVLAFGILFILVFKLIESRFSEIRTLFNEISTMDPKTSELLESNVRYSENKILVRSLNSMISRIKKYENDLEKFRLAEMFASVATQVSHDIRSPLSALEIAISTTDIPENRKRILQQVAVRIRNVAEDLLGRSREYRIQNAEPISGKPAEIVNVVKIVNEIIQENELAAGKINCDLPSELVQVKANEVDLGRIVSNLVNNARESAFQERALKVNVIIREYKNRVSLSIQDNGRGIPADVLPKIGERGFTNGKTHGNGLGVSFAKAKLLEWGGDFQILSKENEGTLVTLNFVKMS